MNICRTSIQWKMRIIKRAMSPYAPSTSMSVGANCLSMDLGYGFVNALRVDTYARHSSLWVDVDWVSIYHPWRENYEYN